MIAATAILSLGGQLLDKFFPDPAQRQLAQLELLKLERQGDLKELEVGMSAIVAEANSDSVFTSSARPAFMYVFYLVILVQGVIVPAVGLFKPEIMELYYKNTALGFNSIPSEMWATFTAGYLGYTGAREYGKQKKRKAVEGLKNFINQK